MEEMYKGYKIKYNEERSIFEASSGNHRLIDAELKKLRSKINKQLAHDSGFKPFEAWHYDNASLQRVRVTSVKQEPVRPYAEPEKYMVRITYLDKSDEDDYHWQRNEVYHDTIIALDPATAKKAEELKRLVDQRKELKKAIEDLANGLPRIGPSDLGITEKAKR